MKLIDSEPMYTGNERAFSKNLEYCDGFDLDKWLDEQPEIKLEEVINMYDSLKNHVVKEYSYQELNAKEATQNISIPKTDCEHCIFSEKD